MINEYYNGNSISRSTFKRDSGGQSSNLYVFMPYTKMNTDQEKTQVVQPQQTSESHLFTQAEPPCKQKLSYQETNTLKTKPIKNDKNRSRELINSHTHSQKPQPQTSQTALELDHSYTSDQVPNEFIRLVKAFFNNCETIEGYWRMAKLAAYQYLFEKDISYVLDTAFR